MATTTLRDGIYWIEPDGSGWTRVEFRDGQVVSLAEQWEGGDGPSPWDEPVSDDEADELFRLLDRDPERVAVTRQLSAEELADVACERDCYEAAEEAARRGKVTVEVTDDETEEAGRGATAYERWLETRIWYSRRYDIFVDGSIVASVEAAWVAYHDEAGEWTVERDISGPWPGEAEEVLIRAALGLGWDEGVEIDEPEEPEEPAPSDNGQYAVVQHGPDGDQMVARYATWDEAEDAAYRYADGLRRQCPTALLSYEAVELDD